MTSVWGEGSETMLKPSSLSLREESALPPAPRLLLLHIEQNMVPLGGKWKKWRHCHTVDLSDLKFGMNGFLMMLVKFRWVKPVNSLRNPFFQISFPA